ncbi:hypothetical protein CHU93_08355 [Sandarakinorhabdus cyanobacteriorum]|uniref:Uncharacterized protein n=1 Tax=Sandarakinorhabdus cyanobacteriorum TaxID=1981098 RepID=A0A255YI17_9SPHN|nr:hypothetical protein [Sandarakinorhabdus cyanobacteriorum]OYQ28831.1 hypothetical protein CHU93_08355 [Sandarakinorhabdus cyanobacteriorum]
MDNGAPADQPRAGLEASLGRLGARLVWAVVAVIAALMLFILFAPLLGIPENRRLSADIAAFDQTARTSPPRQLTGHANWQTERYPGRGGGRFSFPGFDLYLLTGKRLRFSCVAATACPPAGTQAAALPDAVRISFVETASGYRLPLEIRDMAGRIIINRAAALAAIDQQAAWERAHPYDPSADHRLFAVFLLIFAGLGWSIWRDGKRRGQAPPPR